MSAIQKRLLISVGVLAVLAFIIWKVYDLGSTAGSNATTIEWNKEKEKTNAHIMDLIVKQGVKEQAHRNEANRISDELETTNAKFQADIAAMRADYDERLRQSNARAGVYQRLSKAGPAQQERLAGYATGLDASLEEGRQLVKEFRATIEQRDSQLRLLGAQIIADRNLMGGNNEPAGK